MYTQSSTHGTVNIPVNYGGTALRSEKPYIEMVSETEPPKEPQRMPPTPSRPTVEKDSLSTLPSDIPVFKEEKSREIMPNFKTLLSLLKLGKMDFSFFNGLFRHEDGERRDLCDYLIPALALLLLFCKEPDRVGGLMLLSLLLIQ